MTPTTLLCVLTATAAAPLDLEEAVAIAHENTRDVIRAKQDVLQVDVDRARAIGLILPRIDLNLGVSEDLSQTQIIETRDSVLDTGIPAELLPVRNFGTFNDTQTNTFHDPNFTLGISASQLLWDGGRWLSIIQRVSDIDVIRRASLRAVRNNVRARVSRRFYTLAKSVLNTRTAEKQVALTSTQLSQAQERLARGEGRADDVSSATRDLAADRVALARAQAAEQNNRANLNLAMGRRPSHPLRVVVAPEKNGRAEPNRQRRPTNAALVEAALRHRPEMASARASLGLNEKNIDIAQAGHWPSVSLSAAYNRASRRPDRVYANPLDNYTASIRLALRFNIYNGGRIQANVDEARLRLTKAQADHDNLARIVENDVLLRTRNLDLLHEVFELQVVRAKAAEQTAAAAKALYKEGKRSALEVRNAELSLTRARLAVSNARLDIEVAREELRRAIGRPPIDIDALPSGGR